MKTSGGRPVRCGKLDSVASRLRGWRRILLHPHELSAAWWFVLSAILLVLDYYLGPHIQFTATFVVPVLLAAWYTGHSSALSLAVVLPLTHLAFMLVVWNELASASSNVLSTMVRAGVYAFVGSVVARLAQHERELEREVEALEGLLPICMYCKSIRNDTGEWEKLEAYLSNRTDATFTHGVCAKCEDLHYPELKPRSRRTA